MLVLANPWLATDRRNKAAALALVRRLIVLQQVVGRLEQLATTQALVHVAADGLARGRALVDLVLDEEHDVAEAKVRVALAANDQVVAELCVDPTVQLEDLFRQVLAALEFGDLVQRCDQPRLVGFLDFCSRTVQGARTLRRLLIAKHLFNFFRIISERFFFVLDQLFSVSLQLVVKFQLVQLVRVRNVVVT